MTERPRVLLVSSLVADGSVGGAVAAFALRRLGLDVTFVPTVVMPHHPGNGPVTRHVTPDGTFVSLLEAAAETRPAAILSGYFAAPAQVEEVQAAIRALKAAAPDTLYLCDPVIGDAGALYVDPDIAEAIRHRLLPLADCATPNLFECRTLAGLADDAEQTLAASSLGPPAVLATSVPSMLRGKIGNLLLAEGAAWLMEHRALPQAPKGTGDLLAGLLLGRRLQGASWQQAAALALSSVCETVLASGGGPTLPLAACQDCFVAPRAPIDTRGVAAVQPSAGTART